MNPVDHLPMKVDILRKNEVFEASTPSPKRRKNISFFENIRYPDRRLNTTE